LSTPLMTISVCVGVATLMPWASAAPRDAKSERQTELVALGLRAEPDADQRKALLEALVTPATMFATNARMVPTWRWHGASCPAPCTAAAPSVSTATFGSAARTIVPSGPFTEIWPDAIFTSTPFGTSIGIFAMRDMASLRNDAKHFTADAVSARLAVGHHAPRRGKDRHTSPFITRGMSLRPL